MRLQTSRTMACLALCVLSAGWVAGCDEQVDAKPVKEVRVQRVILEDSQGRTRAVFGEFDVEGTKVAGVVFIDLDGKARMLIGTGEKGGAGVQHLDADGTMRMISGTFPDIPAAGTAIFDKAGTARVLMGVNDDRGEAGLNLLDRDGKEAERIGTDGPVKAAPAKKGGAK